ncbi:unnamed protein product, partial [Rotaria sordida]
MLRHLRSCPSKTTDSELSCQQAKINQYYKSTTNELTVVPKPIKDAVTTAITGFVAQDGQAFQLVNIFGYINLAEQLFNSGKLISSSPNIHIANILTWASIHPIFPIILIFLKNPLFCPIFRSKFLFYLYFNEK